MNDWMSALPGFAGVLVGASIGIYGVRWQHRAQLLQEIRTKGAELIFMGDQYRDDSKAPSMFISMRRLTDPPLPPSPQKVRMEQMRSIIRYLELTTNKRIYNLASAFQEATDNITSVHDLDPADLDDRFIAARAELFDALTTGRVRR